jgi:hypothetical protein
MDAEMGLPLPQETAEMTGIEYSVVHGENLMTPVFNKPPLTCLSIFDSILFQSFLDGSTVAFDLCTRQSFPLTGTRPMAFFPPLMPFDDSSSDDETEGRDRTASYSPMRPPAERLQPETVVQDHTPPPRLITSVVTEGNISPHSIPVTRRERLSADEFATIDFHAFEPLLLTGETRDWPAHQRWTFAFFASGQIGATAVQVTHRHGKREEMKLYEYVERFRDEGGLNSRAADPDKPCGYLRGWTYEVDNPGLMQDFVVPAFARDWFDKLPKKEDPMFRWIFLGPSGSKTPLHIDPCLTHAWLAQIRGRKRFVRDLHHHHHHLSLLLFALHMFSCVP